MRSSIILAITKNTLRELRHRKALIILGMTFILGFVAPTLIQLKMVSVVSNGASVNQSALTAGLSQLTIFIGMLSSIFYAAGLVQLEANKRTITTVMIRPIHRWEYLLGRTLGVVCLLTLFAIISMVCAYGSAIVTGSQLESGFALGILQRLCRGISLVFIAASLGSIFSATTTMFLMVGVSFFAFVFSSFPKDFQPVLTFIGNIFHYATPVKIDTDFMAGLDKISDSKTLWLAVAGMIENIMYGIFIFIACSYRFEKKDIQLKEE